MPRKESPSPSSKGASQEAAAAVPPKAARFDAAYYRKYYEGEKTKVHDAARIAHLASFLVGFLAWSDAELRTVLDVGAGQGLLRDWFARNRPDVRYRSVEYSAYACEQYGHEQADIAAFRAKGTFDLVVCQGVLQYLPNAEAAKAIDNLGAMAGGFLYLEAITRRDFDTICDPQRTDGDVHLRAASFYRERLARHFHQVGAGLWYAKSGPLNFYDLEAARL